MRKKIVYLLALLCVGIYGSTRVFNLNESFKDFHFQNILEEYSVRTNTFLDDCSTPINLNTKSIQTTQATIYWDANTDSSWEYYVVNYASVTPTGSGTVSNTNEVIITKDSNGNILLPDTEYEFYVRTVCSSKKFSSWSGPVSFKTTCLPKSLPFTEGFNSNSPTINCWTIIDVANDATSLNGEMIWKNHDKSTYEGDRVMFFDCGFNLGHDDWLISPTVTFGNTKIYALTFYFKTQLLDPSFASYHENQFEIALSTEEVDVEKFTNILLPMEKYTNTSYIKKMVFIKNIGGNVNIGWHIKSNMLTQLYIDKVSIEEINCIPPSDAFLVDVTTSSADFSWEDNGNTSWEYYVNNSGGGVPTGSGTLSNSKNVTFSKTSGTGGVNLQPNTEYEFYVRGNCGTNKYSPWIGPVIFRTQCNPIGLPFWEGFNTDSTTFECWTIRDFDQRPNVYRGVFFTNIWKLIQTPPPVLFPINPIEYEGDQAICFAPEEGEHDDWLISPTFNLDATKYYRLKYHTKVFMFEGTGIKYKVMLSNEGISKSDFKTTLHTRTLNSDVWVEEATIISGVGGEVNLAWKIESDKGGNNLILDNVFFEEVSCPEPFNLGVKDEEGTSATIYWTDNIGTKWEYAVQKAGTYGVPKSGTTTNQKEVVLKQDKNGDSLESNTEYVFYIKSNCSNGDESDWVQFRFWTACGTFKTPFWEGFNSNSKTMRCWNIVDSNGDGTSYPGNQAWGKTFSLQKNQYEGDEAMIFTSYDPVKVNDDWLISPEILFENNKIYRLKYHYRGALNNPENTLEVLGSNSGVKSSDFTHKIVKDESLASVSYKEKKVFIENLSGKVNLAWHLKGQGSIGVFIDNVFVEEVTGCPDPLNILIDDIESNEATISWTDDFGATKWEYYIQKVSGTKPLTAGVLTSSKINTVTKDNNGSVLLPNFEYEVYVRTVCKNGEYSIWDGPHLFRTSCDIYTPPFWEGFNTNSETINCWTGEDGRLWDIKDLSYGAIFEGDQSMLSGTTNTWLISPTFKLDGSKYILKYHYRTSNSGGEFEVLLSSKGGAVSDFTTSLSPMKKYTNDGYKEEVLFLNGINDEINIAWHAKEFGVGLDNVILKKIETCPEPYNVDISNPTLTTLDVSWQQEIGGSDEWEVLVVYFGEDETAAPVKTISVKGSPNTTVTGLKSGHMYSVYVRAKCEDNLEWSDYSTPSNGGTKVSNDDCSSAIKIPINDGIECIETVPFTLTGATVSTVPEPNCNQGGYLAKDVWFEFTATTSAKHMLKFLDRNYNGQIYGALYDGDCSSLTSTALECFEPTYYNAGAIKNFIVFENLIPGKKYYIRLGIWDDPNLQEDFYYKLCITVPAPIEVSPIGEKYTLEELVKDVFVKSNCDLVSNINYKNGDGKPLSQAVNTIGYFNKAKSIFPFEEGIVLSSSEVEYIPGPYNGYFVYRGNTSKRWQGDKEINDAIDNIGGGPFQDKLVTQLQFDFTPVKDSIEFEYLFASNNYYPGSSLACEAGSMFVVLLTDQVTGEQQNIAMIPDTNVPIGINTIRDSEKSKVPCESVNPEYYWKHYDFILRKALDDATEAPIDFVGFTVPMRSQKTYVKPGRKYNIKMALVEFSIFTQSNSAVFFKAGSFDLGAIDLGSDLLVEDINAVCHGGSTIIKSGIVESDELKMVIEWYKDGKIIPGENTPDLEVKEAGEYMVKVMFSDMNCESSGSIKVEFFPSLKDILGEPGDIVVCHKSLKSLKIALTQIEEDIFKGLDRELFNVSYFDKEENARLNEEALLTPDAFDLSKEPKNQNLFVRVENVETGCFEIFVFSIEVEEGESPEKVADVKVCATYVFPDLKDNQLYYSASEGTGLEYEAGETLDVPGNYTIYVLQLNNEAGCFEEVSYTVSIVAPVVAAVFEDAEYDCELYVLDVLPPFNKYFTQPNGRGVELYPGMELIKDQTIYVYARSEDSICVDESSFTITYTECPIQKGLSPNGDGVNDVFDLSVHGVESIKIFNRWGAEVFSFGNGYTNEWHGQDKNGSKLPDGTYYYMIISRNSTRTGWVQINR